MKTIYLCTCPVVELFRLLESLVSRSTVLHGHADSIERQPALKEAFVNNRSVNFLIPDSKFGGDTAWDTGPLGTSSDLPVPDQALSQSYNSYPTHI